MHKRPLAERVSNWMLYLAPPFPTYIPVHPDELAKLSDKEWNDIESEHCIPLKPMGYGARRKAK